jgi:SSS family solute:Na+ symporter
LAHLSVVFFALVNVVGMLAYAFKGIGKFAAVMLPWHLTDTTAGLFSNENLYAVIILGYFAGVVLIGLWVSRRGAKDLDSYFLGGKALPWYLLGISDASGMFDISGTMLMVYWLFVYGLKSIWLPWVWPTFNQIFLMMFMSAWLRRSNVMTGAQWMQTRFGNDRGATAPHNPMPPPTVPRSGRTPGPRRVRFPIRQPGPAPGALCSQNSLPRYRSKCVERADTLSQWNPPRAGPAPTSEARSAIIMKLHAVDIAIIVGYFLVVILVGLWVSRRGAKDLDSYFLGSKKLPWYLLGVSDASGMFDISGTMWLVYVLFLYGLKSIWLPWVWPTFNQIFLMVFVSDWLRRSNVLTGAEWIQTRFGRGTGANLAHLSVVLFALVNVVGMLAYGFKGIGKFADVMLPWQLSASKEGLFSNANIYAIIILSLTSIYAIKGGMVSVVITEVMQFTILTITSIIIGIVAMYKVSPDMIKAAVPEGWANPFFGKTVGLDWSAILPQANEAIKQDGNELFGIIFGLMFFKGVMASLAGPAPNYDMQRILATRNTREASLMSGMVNVVLMFPRYFMIAGLTVMALVFFMPQLHGQAKPDFEELLPNVLQYVPVGVVGLLLAGLIAAFMSNFAATLNAAPAYLINDIYKRFINPNSAPKADVFLNRVASVVVLAVGIHFGQLTNRITD